MSLGLGKQKVKNKSEEVIVFTNGGQKIYERCIQGVKVN